MGLSTELNTGRNAGHGWIALGCLLAAVGVALGAIGAHFLESWLAANFEEDAARREELWDTGVRYQMFCAFGLICIGLCSRVMGIGSKVCGSLMLIGALLFSGCLYGYVMTDVKPLVRIVPLGGFSMIFAWLTFAWSVYSAGRESQESP